MNNGTYTSASMLKLIGKRLKDYRIHVRITQKELAERSGVSLRCIQHMENGYDIQVSSLFKVLDALDLSNNINALIPDMTKRPSNYLISDSKRKRVRARSEDNNSIKADIHSFIWGEDR